MDNKSFLKQKIFTLPPFSVIENIGLDGSGINCDISELFSLNKNNRYKNSSINFNKIYYNNIEEEILNNFYETKLQFNIPSNNMNKFVLGISPARGGSKGIPKKYNKDK